MSDEFPGGWGEGQGKAPSGAGVLGPRARGVGLHGRPFRGGIWGRRNRTNRGVEEDWELNGAGDGVGVGDGRALLLNAKQNLLGSILLQ